MRRVAEKNRTWLSASFNLMALQSNLPLFARTPWPNIIPGVALKSGHSGDHP